ncbi:CLUMA_CG000709, isoform A [Clunio marinus]|uniref:CLUMA_CG000709, isoform A n=1 Tax=Clunio marinus TaxID=568069 RepID=A0A1J1HHJ0_9DIPT|nr:CLUMA_CG000709, isoform A [Clunio marinus]
MKTLLILFCFIAVITARKNHGAGKKREATPTCENPPKTTIPECCANFPKPLIGGLMQTLKIPTNSKFDASKAKEGLTSVLGENDAWNNVIIDKIFKECAASDSKNIMHIVNCIHRELFFQCPGMSTSDECKELVSFGKGCPKFPFHEAPLFRKIQE